MEAAAHRQFVAHLKITHKDIDMTFAVGVQIDLALRPIQDVETLVGFISHLLKEWFDSLAIVLDHDKVKVTIFTRKEFLQVPAPHADSQSTEGAHENRVRIRGI